MLKTEPLHTIIPPPNVKEAPRVGEDRDRQGRGGVSEVTAQRRDKADLGQFVATITYVTPLGWRRHLKRIVQRIKSAHFFDGDRGRPRHAFLYRPNQPNDLREVRRQPNLEHFGERVSHDEKRDVPKRKSKSVDNASCRNIGLDFFGRHVGLIGDFIYYLFTRAKYQWPSRRISQCRTPGEPHGVFWQGLLFQVEAMIFRVWYHALGRMKMLYHKSRLHRPCCNGPLILEEQSGSASLLDHRPENWGDGGF
jgi:hypothetical protein